MLECTNVILLLDLPFQTGMLLESVVFCSYRTSAPRKEQELTLTKVMRISGKGIAYGKFDNFLYKHHIRITVITLIMKIGKITPRWFLQLGVNDTVIIRWSYVCSNWFCVSTSDIKWLGCLHSKNSFNCLTLLLCWKAELKRTILWIQNRPNKAALTAILISPIQCKKF